MSLDPRTLLFSLILTYALTVLSLFVAALGRIGNNKPDGMDKWAVAMLLETATWALIAARGSIPDVYSIILANGLKATSHAFILAAIYEFQQRKGAHWQYWAPIVLALLMATICVSDIRDRFIWGGLIYGVQMAFIARALLSDAQTRAGRAWRLLFGGIVMLVFVLMLRAGVALSGHTELAQLQSTDTIHPVQIISFMAMMATALLGSIGFVLMVKERADRETMRMAMTDSLTEIPNRRALMEYAERVLARRSGFPVSLLMIDVDNFKLINDTYGHQAGDEILHEIAKLLAGRLRGHDFLGRYGGEEFCVIAPDTPLEGGASLAEFLRAAVAAMPFHTTNGDLSISVSIGVTHCSSNVRCKLNQILAEADAALYAAKQAGRNRVDRYVAAPA